MTSQLQLSISRDKIKVITISHAKQKFRVVAISPPFHGLII